jgi:hypothetical protein
MRHYVETAASGETESVRRRGSTFLLGTGTRYAERHGGVEP